MFDDLSIEQSTGGGFTFIDGMGLFFFVLGGGGVADLEDSDLTIAISGSSFGIKGVGEFEGVELFVSGGCIEGLGFVEELSLESLFDHKGFSIILFV